MSSTVVASLVVLVTVFSMLGFSVWIAVSLLITGMVGIGVLTDIDSIRVLSNILWNTANSSSLVAVPLFVLMGEIILRSGIAKSLFEGLSPWVNKLPGRLLHVVTLACTLFAAVSGSSAATCATIGQICLPELDKRNYSRKMSLGLLPSAGTLGFLIPPSLIMLIYGLNANVSIGQLFIAGIVPGLILAIFFIGYVVIVCLIHPEYAPDDGVRYTMADRIKSLPKLLPITLLIMAVLGSIYTGVATTTEAAAVGSIGALLNAAYTRNLTKENLITALLGTVRTSCMIILIMIGASYLSVAVGYLGLAASLTQLINSLGVSNYMLIVLLTIMYLIMGCFLDGFSMVVMSLPIALPLITSAGFDPLWFGIYMVIVVQISQITPPVGFSLFIVNGLSGVDIITITKYVMPTFVLMLLTIVIITLFPEIVLFLPRLMIK